MHKGDLATEPWIGAHIFIRRQERRCFDEVIRSVVRPIVDAYTRDETVRRWFFIRYAQHGPHIRLRLLRDPRISEEILRLRLQRDISALLPDDIAGVADGLIERHARSSACPALWWVEYQPETARYGSDDALALSEAIFEVSSLMSSAVIADLDSDDLDGRWGYGIAAMICLVARTGIDRANAAELMRDHRDLWFPSTKRASPTETWNEYDRAFHTSPNYAPLIDAVWNATREDSSALPEPLQLFVDRLSPIMASLQVLTESQLYRRPDGVATSWQHAVSHLTSSHLHMTNNRLGIQPNEEPFLAHVAMQALDVGQQRYAAAKR